VNATQQTNIAVSRTWQRDMTNGEIGQIGHEALGQIAACGFFELLQVERSEQWRTRSISHG
jgi:hypothetical protein